MFNMHSSAISGQIRLSMSFTMNAKSLLSDFAYLQFSDIALELLVGRWVGRRCIVIVYHIQYITYDV